jgi:cell division septal protein FtsQ
MDKRVRERRRLITRERGRRRGGLVFLGVLVVVAAILFLWLRSSSVFAVEQVTAPDSTHVTQQQIADAVASARGESLLKVSTSAIERDLAKLPYVREVHVYRVFPHALEVRLEEYEPVARVQASSSKAWLVADDGRLLELVGAQASKLLPLIVPDGQFQGKAGEIIPSRVLGALGAAELLEGAELSARLPDVGYVSVSAGGDVVVHMNDGTELRLGAPTDLKQKMMVAAGIIQDYLRDGKALEYVDASAVDRVAVKAK